MFSCDNMSDHAGWNEGFLYSQAAGGQKVEVEYVQTFIAVS